MLINTGTYIQFSLGDYILYFYWQSLKMISAYEKVPLRSVDYLGQCFWKKKKMLLMSFECKSLALSTTNEIPFIFFVFRWQLQSQRHISKKLGGGGKAQSVCLDILL